LQSFPTLLQKQQRHLKSPGAVAHRSLTSEIDQRGFDNK